MQINYSPSTTNNPQKFTQFDFRFFNNENERKKKNIVKEERNWITQKKELKYIAVSCFPSFTYVRRTLYVLTKLVNSNDPMLVALVYIYIYNIKQYVCIDSYANEILVADKKVLIYRTLIACVYSKSIVCTDSIELQNRNVENGMD